MRYPCVFNHAYVTIPFISNFSDVHHSSEDVRLEAGEQNGVLEVRIFFSSPANGFHKLPQPFPGRIGSYTDADSRRSKPNALSPERREEKKARMSSKGRRVLKQGRRSLMSHALILLQKRYFNSKP